MKNVVHDTAEYYSAIKRTISCHLQYNMDETEDYVKWDEPGTKRLTIVSCHYNNVTDIWNTMVIPRSWGKEKVGKVDQWVPS